MLDNVLIVDTETTGLHPDKGAKVIEIGAILYNIQHKTILQNFSTLFPCEENPVEDINGIKAEATRSAIPLELVNGQLLEMVRHCDVIVAHNAPFDRKFIKTLAIWSEYGNKPWICTKSDFKWPVSLHRTRLQDICEAMGVKYIDAHRALNDCKLIAECFNRIPNLGQLMTNAFNKGQRTTGFASAGNQYV